MSSQTKGCKEAELVGITFGLMNDEELERRVVYTLSENPSQYKKDRPQLDSVTDPRSGSTQSNIPCSICAKGPIDCQGHLGRVELAIPCAIGAFLQYMDRILTCLCWQCSALLIPEKNSKLIQYRKTDVPNVIGVDKATKAMYGQALKTRTCFTCGAENPIKWIRFVDVLLRPVWAMKDAPTITMETIYSMCQNIKPEDNHVLGFHASRSPLSALVVRYFILPPMLIRSSRNRNSVDDLTDRLDNIVRTNKIVKETHRSGNLSLTTFNTQIECYGTDYFECIGEDVYDKKDRPRRSATKKNLVPKHLIMLWDLQRQVAGFTFSKLNQKKDLDYGRIKGCVSDKFAASQNGENKGIMRGQVLSKRADFSSRGPVSPDSNINFDEVSVPISVCKALTKEEHVTKLNYARLQATVLRGQQYPGANRITRNGIDYDIPNFAQNGLQIGDIVHRHLIRGDWVLGNRQPTLHRYSMMALKVVPKFVGFSFGVSPLLTVPYAMDFDGDEMNILVLPDDKGTAEAIILMAAGENMFRNGSLIIQLIQHAVLGAYLITANHTIITKDIAYQLCMITRLGDWLFSKLKNVIFPISGRTFISLLFDPHFYDGTFQLKKSSVNDILGNIIHYYGNGVNILSGFCRLFELYARMVGTSLSFRDGYIEKPQWLLDELMKIKKQVALIEQSQSNIPFNDYILKNKAEDKIKEYFDKSRDIVAIYVREELKKRSNHPLIDIADSGSKGNVSQILQVCGILGQLLDHNNNRLNIMTPHESKDLASSKGNVENCYSEGLSGLAYYYNSCIARDGFVDTAMMIKRAGYLFRRMCKALEDCVVACDNSVRAQSSFMVIKSFGFDTTHLRLVRIHTIDMTQEEIKKKYFFPHGKYAQREIDVLLYIRNHILCSKNLHRSIALPIQWSILKHIVSNVTKEDEDTSLPLPMDMFADLVRMTVAGAWVRLVTEDHVPSIDLIRLSFQENLSTHHLIHVLGVRTINQLTCIMKHVCSEFAKNVSCPGTPIGPIVAEDFCAPVSQMSLKSFHYAGSATALTSGLDRIEEILTLTKEIATPSMKLYPIDANFNSKTLIQLRMIDITTGWLDHPVEQKENIEQEEEEEQDMVYCCLLLNKDILIEREIAPERICEFIREHPQMDKSAFIETCEIWADTWWVSITLNPKSKFASNDKKAPAKNVPKSSLASNVYYKLTAKDSNRLIAGVKNITDFYETTEVINSRSPDGNFVKTTHKVIVTRGSNMYDLSKTNDPNMTHHKHFYTHLTKSNDIVNEVYRLYGIDAACKAIEDELVEVMLKNAASVSRAHIRFIASFMCSTGVPRALTFAGMTATSTNKLKLCTYERILKGFLDVGTSGHINNLTGTTEAIMVGKRFSIGTGFVKLLSIKDDVYKNHPIPVQHLVDYPLPPLDVCARDINFLDTTKEYMKCGGQKKQEEPIVKKIKVKKEIIKIPKPLKLKPIKPPKQPKEKKLKKSVKKPLKESKPKKKNISKESLLTPRRKWTLKKKKQPKQKKVCFQNEGTWNYPPVFTPAASPEHS